MLLAAILVFSARIHAAIPPPTTYDWEAQRWSTQVATNGGAGVLSGAAYRAGSTFMIQSKWWDVRRYIGRAQLYVGTDTNAMVFPIITDWQGTGLRDVLNGFVAGDFTESTGLTGNTTTKYLECGSLFLDGNTGPTNIHFAVYTRTNKHADVYSMGIQANSSEPLYALYISSSGGSSGAFLGSIASTSTFADTNGVGLNLASRGSTTSLIYYLNGVSKNTNSTSDTSALSHIGMVVHALNSSGVILLNTANTLSYYGLGLAIPADRTKPYNDMVQNVQTTMSRYVQ